MAAGMHAGDARHGERVAPHAGARLRRLRHAQVTATAEGQVQTLPQRAAGRELAGNLLQVGCVRLGLGVQAAQHPHALVLPLLLPRLVLGFDILSLLCKYLALLTQLSIAGR